MKFKWKLKACLLLMAISIYFFQVGPIGIKSGDDVVLAKTNLHDGSSLHIVAHRTGNFLDAYEVRSYRVMTNKDVWVCFLGYEDGYWWGTKLRPTEGDASIEILNFGSLFGTYSVTNGTIRRSEKPERTIKSYKCDGSNQSLRIPQVVRL